MCWPLSRLSLASARPPQADDRKLENYSKDIANGTSEEEEEEKKNDKV